jgi:predicted ATPase/class 3 adenylate cyclase
MSGPLTAAELERAIAQLESQRAVLGDVAVDVAVEALRQHVAAATRAEPQRLRQVSVLFADVAGSTAMLGRVGAEDTMDLMGRALADFAAAVQQWDGAVLSFTGDGIKAAFGVHGLREDEAERAVRAGLKILEVGAHHAQQVRDALGIQDFGVRVGIHTGPVLLGGGPEVERTAMGHAVNLAARMEQSAPVGRLRVSDATWAQVRGLFRAEAQPPLLVKGHDEPLRTWLITGVERDPDAAVQRGLDGVAAPLVGRAAELTRLTELVTRVRQQGQLAAALVIGDAGVGKTRLRRELLAALSLREGEPGLLQARAHPSSPLQPYGLLRQLLARWLHIADDAPAAQARARLVEGLAPWLGEQAETQAARIGTLIGMDFSGHPAVAGLPPSTLQAQAFEALREALLAYARQTPLLLVLDDLHWADDASLAFVRLLLTRAQAPLALLLLARPTLHERSAVLAPADGVALPVIELTALSAAAGEQLLQALLARLPAVPATLTSLLLERAAGNPFFLEALVGMLIDDGVIDASTSPWQLRTERLAALRVPPTLVGVLQARLDVLPAHELAALQAASIVGPVFWDAALAALMEDGPAALPALAQRALVAARSGSAFNDTAEHAFAHQLLHDTTYDTVLKEQRRAGHARAAQWLAERVSDRAAEFLAIAAEHYERAGDSAKALEFWDRAYRDARQRFALSAALTFIERALVQPALVDARWRYNLLQGRSTVLDFMGKAQEAAAARAECAAWAELQDDDVMRAGVLQQEMLRADHEGRPEDARQLAEQVLQLVAGQPYGAGEAALAHGELAWLALQRAEYDEVARQIAAGIAQARISATQPAKYGGFRRYEQQLRVIEISALLEQERYTATLEAIEQARNALGHAASPHDRASLLQRECMALRGLGRPEAAEVADALLQLSQQSGVARLVVSARHSRARTF